MYVQNHKITIRNSSHYWPLKRKRKVENNREFCQFMRSALEAP